MWIARLLAPSLLVFCCCSPLCSMPTFSSPPHYSHQKQNNDKMSHFVFYSGFNLGAFSDSVCLIVLTEQVLLANAFRSPGCPSGGLPLTLVFHSSDPYASRYVNLCHHPRPHLILPLNHLNVPLGMQSSCNSIAIHSYLPIPFTLLSIASSPLDAFARTSARPPQAWRLLRSILSSLIPFTPSMNDWLVVTVFSLEPLVWRECLEASFPYPLIHPM